MRWFSEKQTAEILATAAELQGDASAPSRQGAISEEELKVAARDLGITEQALQAAIERSSQPQAQRKGFFGGPLNWEIEIAFPGRCTDEQWEQVVADVRRALGEQGTIEQRGSTREWSGKGGGIEETTVNLREAEGRLLLTITSRLEGFALIAHLLGALPALIGIGIGGSMLHLPPALGAGAIVAWLATTFAGTRGVLNRILAARKKRVEELAITIRDRLEQSTDDVSHRLAQSGSSAQATEEDILLRENR